MCVLLVSFFGVLCKEMFNGGLLIFFCEIKEVYIKIYFLESKKCLWNVKWWWMKVVDIDIIIKS